MRKITTIITLLVFSLVFSQKDESKIQNYLNEHYTEYGLSYNDVQHWSVASTATSKTTNITNYYLEQEYNGVSVFGTVSNIWIKNGKVINYLNLFAANLQQKISSTTPALDATTAFTAALNNVDQNFQSQVLENISQNKLMLSNGDLEEDRASAELMYYSDDNQMSFRLVWSFTFYAQDYNHLWDIRVDATTGEILDKKDLTISCNFDGPHTHNSVEHKKEFDFSKIAFKNTEDSPLYDIQSGSYRVYPYYVESPNHGSRQLIVSPENATASPTGWLDVNGIAQTITRGNNVHAQEDTEGDNGTGYSPDGGASNIFDFPYGGTGVSPNTYQDAAITNLFYMNNIMHDIYYQYGFDEPNGNFQLNNYGNGGATSFTGDYVYADAQDGGGTNNANFSTPVDGQRPRMQMYLWTYGPPPTYLTINSPSPISGDYVSLDNNFDPGHVDIPLEPNGIVADIVLYQDAVDNTTDACSAAVNSAALNGKIAIIRRGNCDFVVKVKNAQNAGALAVIMVNNTADGYVNMGGADATITIPAIFVNQADGEAIIASIENGNTVNGTVETPSDIFINSDGDFDNVIIAHEYGHGISTRLTGGPGNSNCLFNNEQMGEGWSDWIGLMLQIQSGDTGTDARGIGTFVASQDTDGVGIRQYPYSTDMSVNPLTFEDTNDYVYTGTDGTQQTDVHSVGTVWASMLWDLTWAYIDKYGYDPDIYNGTGGNNKVMQLVLDAMKLQPCYPGFVSGRDAIIAADQASTGGEDYCMIWEVFARRGLGVNASSGSTGNSTDQVEDFTEPAAGPNCTTLDTDSIDESRIGIFPNPTSNVFNINVAGYAGDINVKLIDLNGRIILEKTGEMSNNYQFNVANVTKGMYLLQLTGEQGFSHTEKVIIN